ncbi:MAG TPA: cell division protein ZapA [Kiloniellales bacterium]|nr:cell division protein ZapA [Kiloniellales bacterium]
MGRVTLAVNGRSYEVACADGQEEQLIRLGEDLDQRVAGLATRLGQVGEARLLLLGALLLANELEQLKRGSRKEDGAEAIDTLQAATERVDALAAQLDQA